MWIAHCRLTWLFRSLRAWMHDGAWLSLRHHTLQCRVCTAEPAKGFPNFSDLQSQTIAQHVQEFMSAATSASITEISTGISGPVSIGMESLQVTQHIRRFFAKLSDLRKDGRLFDYTIYVGDRKIQAHKFVLAASSDYFGALFAHSFTEENSVRLQDTDPDAIEAIINFCYTHKLDLSDESIPDILLAASMLQVQAVLELCVNYLGHRIDSSNCLSIAQISERCNLAELGHRANAFCMENFKSVINEQEFLQIDQQTLSRIISDENLEVDDDSVVIGAVIRWCEADIEARKEQLYSLLKEVKRSSRAYRIYAAGGWHAGCAPGHPEALASAEVYDPKSDVWKEITPMQQKRCGAGLAVLADSIYAIGGHDGSTFLRTVERFDIESGSWTSDVASLKHARTSVGVVQLDGRIYAIGGQCEVRNRACEFVEVYDPKKNTWQDCKSLNYPRLGPGVAAHNGYIYVIGGGSYVTTPNGTDNAPILASVDRYDPKTDSWESVAPMRLPRKHLGCCTYRGRIYAVGGRNEDGETASAEVYEPQEDRWLELAPMKLARSGLGLVEAFGELYAVGGQNADDHLNDVEAYNPEKNAWVPKRSMQQRRLGGGTAVHSKRFLKKL